VKTCGCGRTYDRADWLALPLVGYMDDSVECLELRNCPCGNTLAIVIDLSQDLLRELARVHIYDARKRRDPIDVLHLKATAEDIERRADTVELLRMMK
jgi:hypothetical protein